MSMYDAFISYSRRDKAFVERLVRALEAREKSVWVDFEDIPFASDWWDEICQGIEGSRYLIFVLSPNSLESQVTSMEVNQALRNHKRLIPLLLTEPERDRIPREIAALNWIFFNNPDDFDTALAQLIDTLDNNSESMRQHTRLLLRAREWERKGHSNSLLLRGEELAEMEPMLQRDDMTEIMREFLEQSIGRRRQMEIIWRFIFGFMGGLAGMGFWAFSVFRSVDLITPLRLIYTLSLGEVFGLFTGLLAVLSHDLPLRFQQRLAPRPLQAVKAAACFGIGILAWAIFGWFYLQNPTLTEQDVNALLFGGFGLGLGFVITLLTKPRGIIAMLITAISIYLPMYVTLEAYSNGSEHIVPLVYFNDPYQIFSVGIPMVILIAIGTNAQAFYRDLRALIKR